MNDYKFFCPACGKHIQCGVSYCGSQINCPVCHQTIIVPKPIASFDPLVQARKKAPLVIVSIFLCAIAASVAIFLFLKSQQIAKPPITGLVALWNGNGNAEDSVSHQNATLQGGVSFSRGLIRKSFVFNTPEAAVVIPANPKINVGTGDGFTLEAWINPNDVSTQYPVMEWNQGVHLWISVAWSGGGGVGCIYANIADMNSRKHAISSSPGIVQAGKFQHIAVTYDKKSGNTTLYYKGTIVAVDSVGIFTPRTDNTLLLGHRDKDPDLSFQGILSEIGIYNRALSASEINSIYKAGVR